MTTAVGTGQGNTLVYRFFAGSGDDGLIFNSAIIYSNLTSTGFTLTRTTLDNRFLDPGPPVTLVVTGTNFAYTPVGANTYTISGTINSVTYSLNGGSQTWSGLNVSASDALAAAAAFNDTAFDSLFFAGDDSFTWSVLPAGDPNVPTIYGFDGNDVFNIANWTGSGFLIDGGAGNDTINLSVASGGNLLSFHVSNVENNKTWPRATVTRFPCKAVLSPAAIP